MLFILKNKILYINKIKNIFNKKKNYKYLTKIYKSKKKSNNYFYSF